MRIIRANTCFIGDSRLVLASLIREQMVSLTLSKEQYDLRFPQHKKDLSNATLWGIARVRVQEELSIPPSWWDDHQLQPIIHIH